MCKYVSDIVFFNIRKTRFDAGNKSGKNVYWKSSFLEDLTDDFIDSVVKLYKRAPEGTTIEVIFALLFLLN